MARMAVVVETSEEALSEGGYLAHVPELPGCTARGTTKEEAIDGARAAIVELVARLNRHGLPAPDIAGDLVLDVTESDDPTLPSDYVPLSDRDLEELATLARISREALLELLLEMPPAALGWRPTEDDWALRWVFAHVAGADVFYASRLEDGLVPELSWRLRTTRGVLLERLAEVPSSERGRVTLHDDERWTPRKAARRMLEHEYEHLQQLRTALEEYRRQNP